MGITTAILAEVNKQRVGIRNATEFVAYGSANLLPVGCEFFGRWHEADDGQYSACRRIQVQIQSPCGGDLLAGSWVYHHCHRPSPSAKAR
jgi:hypothetical protein